MLGKIANIGWVLLGLLLDSRARNEAKKAEKKAAELDARRQRLENLNDSK